MTVFSRGGDTLTVNFEKMPGVCAYVLVVLVPLVASFTPGALLVDMDGNLTENINVTDGGFVPAAFTKVSQIIAREGTCALIDCNVTGDPFPSVQWFNSHGELLDTTNGEKPSAVTNNKFFLEFKSQQTKNVDQNVNHVKVALFSHI